jgi:iron complex transport system permease protein
LSSGKIFWFFLSLVLLFVAACYLALFSGQVPISIASVFDPGRLDNTSLILWQIRLPRILLAILAGSSLAIAGTTFQGLLRNPLADPFVLGVSSGAALLAVIALALCLPLVPLWAFAGALGTILLVFLIARIRKEITNLTMILAGVILSSFFSALMMLVISFSGSQLRGITFWLMGNLGQADWLWLKIGFAILISCFLLIQAYSRYLNTMILGEEGAQCLGIEVKHLKYLLFTTASLLTGMAVAMSGLIGYVGLIIPHICRLFGGADNRLLLPASAIGGAAFLVAADTIGRTIMPGTEIPVGVITAILGAPLFIYLFLGVKRKN